MGLHWQDLEKSGPKWFTPAVNEAFDKGESVQVLRGSSTATVDDRGRLKLPSAFKSGLESFASGEGGEATARFYLTSLDGREGRLYPLPVWEGIEDRLSQMPSTHPARRKFLEITAYYGAEIELDGQGRFVIPPILREDAQLAGEIVLMGQLNYLALWNRANYIQRKTLEPLTEEHHTALAEYGI